MPDPAAALDFQITASSWTRVPSLRPRLRKAAVMTAAHLPRLFQVPFSATVLLAGDARVRQLNRDFRGIDKPTNVLSFPQYLPEAWPKARAGETLEIGDIALAYAYVAAEARREGKKLIDHITHLTVHGLLHLFGYDHMNDQDATTMEKLEIKIMAALSLPDPYAFAPESLRS